MQFLSSLITNYLETGQYEKQLSPDTIKASPTMGKRTVSNI